MARKDGKVLYITGGNLLLPYDDQRKGRSSPLKYMLVRCPADDDPAGQIHNMRIETLKTLPGGWDALVIYYEICRQYLGNKIAPLRCWLLNYRKRAASSAEIAQAIGWRRRGVPQALRLLQRVELLEWRQVSPAEIEEAIRLDRTFEICPRPPCPRRDRQEAGKDPTPSAQAGGDPRSQKPLEGPAEDGARSPEAQGQGSQTRGSAGSPAGENGQPRQTAAESGSGHGGTAENAGVLSGCGPGGFRNVPERAGGMFTGHSPPDTADPPTASAAPPPLSADGNGNPGQDTAGTAPAAPPPDTGTGAEPTADGQPAPATPTGTDTPTGPAGTGDRSRADGHANGQGSTGSVCPASGTAGRAVEPSEADPLGGQDDEDAQWADVDNHAEAMADGVMAVLYQNRGELLEQGRRKVPVQLPDEFATRERACLVERFRSWLPGMNIVQRAKLQDKALGAARDARKRTPKPGKSWGAIWTTTMNRSVAAFRAGLRSGPP